MDRISDIKRVTVVGLLINLGLCIAKLTAGVVGNSQSVIADGIHSISDMITDMAVLVGARFWLEPADQRHPYGHARIENMVALGMAYVLAGVAAGLVISALSSLRTHATVRPGWIAFAAAILSLVVKEVLYRWTVRVGTRVKSPAVVANAWHHRSDAMSSIPAAIAVAGARLAPGWDFLDHVGSIVVSLFIVKAAWDIGSSAFDTLTDRGAPSATVEEIYRLAVADPDVESVHRVRTRRMGYGWYVDLHLLVDGLLPVWQGHDIATRVHDELLEKGPGIMDVLVHVEPAAANPTARSGAPMADD